jgi:1,4-dihydroxy-2-naphthoate octaprenyltransferase
MQKGLMSEKAMIRGMILCILSIVLGGIYLISVGGWMIGALTLLAILLAFGYTAGPFPLAYLGLGDLFVIAFFGVAATSCSFFLQTGYVSSASLFMGLLMGFLCNAPLVINNLRDEEEDRKVAKKTLIVRMGQESGKSFLFLCALIPAAGTPLVAYLLGKTFLSLAALPLLFLFPYHLPTCKKPHDFLPLLPRFSLMIALYTFLFIIALLFS